MPWSFTLGTVSQIRKNKKWTYGEGDEEKSDHLATVIQTQTPISPGNSGGPLFVDSGKIIGINTWGADGQNLNFAVAVDHAKEFIKAHPQWDHLEPYMPNRPSQPWTIFTGKVKNYKKATRSKKDKNKSTRKSK